MLRRLFISNYALIREMEVKFPGGLTVITGETGAGKSIFLEALGLALGRRADSSALAGREKRCVVEAEFEVSGADVSNILVEQGIDPEEVLTLRREISPEGRSRSFVNDAVVPLQTLKELGAKLVDIHSQHQTLEAGEGRFQLELLDAFAGSGQLLAEYRQYYQGLTAARKKLAALKESQSRAAREQDYLQFVFNELQAAGLEEGKYERLTEEGKKLENMESIRSALSLATSVIGEGEPNALTLLAQARSSLGSISKYGQEYSELNDRINSVIIELKDIYSAVGSGGENLVVDESRLNTVNEYLDRVSRLTKKHQVTGEVALIELRDSIEAQLVGSEEAAENIKALEKEIATLENKATDAAAKLRKKRLSVVAEIEKKTMVLLAGVSMPNATLRITLADTGMLGQSGSDAVSFLFSANKGDQPADLDKVASGGELSRLMLCLKSLLAGKKKLPAIIFDEIDSGVSGEVAARIGSILEKMSGSMQVITITHLPQMASRGAHHLFVYKKEEGERTVSYIRTLSEEERVREIAKMLSAGMPGESALQNARELLSA